MVLEIQNGNIFTAPVDCIVNPVNCMGISGKGLALQFKELFPNNFIAYNQYCKEGLLHPGEVFLFKENDMYIANLATKYHWRYLSNYIWIEKGLCNLRDVLLANHICSVGITKIGCGLGGLSWSKVKPMIVNTLGTDISIVMVYE